jgi:hypothetical protein
MSETIIIEANREIAFKDELKSLRNSNLNNNPPNFPNYKWRTQIQTGIQLEVGDQVSVEATMIQQKGSPEETIEFSGKNNIRSPFGFVDNVAGMTFQFYITNRQQFNCPLPLNGTEIKNADADVQTLNYGLTDVSTFAKFVGAYPYRGIEGMYKDGTTYKEVAGGGVFSKPPQPLDDTSPIRLFLMNNEREFKSFQTADGEIPVIPRLVEAEVEVSVDEGFNTPENVAQRITEQFHQRNGTPADGGQGWNEEFIQGATYGIDAGKNIFRTTNALITDQLYRSVPTSTGDLLDGRLAGRWATKFAGENGTEGDNYTEAQGLEFLYSNMLCGDPDRFISSCVMMDVRKNNFNANNIPATPELLGQAGIYTGDQGIVNDIGQYGANLVILDQTDYETSTLDYDYPTDKSAGGTINALQTLTINVGELLTTNAVYNLVNVQRLGEMLTGSKVPAEGFSPTSPSETYRQYFTNLQFGRANDQASCGSTGAKIFLSQPRARKGIVIPALPNSYPNTINGHPAIIGFRNQCSYDSGWFLRAYVFWTEIFDQNSTTPYNFTFPSNSVFTLKNSKGKYGDITLSSNGGYAIIPVFYKEANLPTPALKDIPFCAFINVDHISYDGANGSQKRTIPAIAQGEFIGVSPSMYDHLLSKVVSTQKVVATGSTTYPDHTEPNTRTYSYMPYCMIGADNPTLVYDDNSSRMAFKDFHTAVRSGNGIFQEPLDHANEQASIESMVVNNFDSAICGTDNVGNKISYAYIVQAKIPFPVISSQSGIALSQVLFPNIDGEYQGGIITNTPETFSYTLFDKLGFIAEQLIPFTGFRQNQFNRGNYNSVLGNNVNFSDKYNNMVKPFTTNAYISGADQLSIVKNAKGQQMENLGATATNEGTYVNAESDELIALNLPSKLDYPYLVVYSDIVRNTKFFGGANGQQKVPAMAYISRNYATGDYFYSFSTGWTYTIDTPYVLTDFTTQIMLPDGSPAPINKNSSVVYKITKQAPIPPPLSVFGTPQNEKQIKQKTDVKAKN